MSETKNARAQRIAQDNADAAQIPVGATYEDDLFGTVTFVGPTGTQDMGWDNYTVTHGGFDRTWSSAVLARSFRVTA